MTIQELWRYPVKSLAGERIERAEVTEAGIVGDRMVLVADPAVGSSPRGPTPPCSGCAPAWPRAASH